MAKATLEFKLEIGPGVKGAYPVVARSPAGQVREILDFALLKSPAVKNLLRDLQSELLRPPKAPQGTPADDVPPALELGALLFDALFVEQVLDLYDTSWEMATSQEAFLRLSLSIASPDLAALPWEFLYDPRRNEHLCLSISAPMVRHLTPTRTPTLSAITPPLRILAVAASPKDWPALDVARERHILNVSLNPLQARELVEVKWVEGQAWREVQRLFWSGPWHVLHFVGHGGFDPTAQEGTLVFADDNDQARRVSDQHLAELLAGSPALRLVVLSSGTGMAGDRPDSFAMLATHLVEQGIPNVLTLPYRVEEKAASEFFHAYYGALSAAVPVDTALVYARAALHSAVPGSAAWGVPALFGHAPERPIFERPSVMAMARQRGDEALHNDDFERAIARYSVALDLGADAALKEKRTLAETTRDQLAQARDRLKTLPSNAQAQADTLSSLIEELHALQNRLPASLAIQAELSRAREKLRGLRDRAWQEGKHLLDVTSVSLTPGHRLKRMQEGIRQLESAQHLDDENLPKLGQDLESARRQIQDYQATLAEEREERRRLLRKVGLFAAIGVGLALLLVLILSQMDLFGPPRTNATPTPGAALTSPTSEGAPTSTSAIASTGTQTPLAAKTSMPTHTAIPATSLAAVSATPSPLPGGVTSSARSPTATPSNTPLPSPSPEPTQAPSATPTAEPSPPPPTLRPRPTIPTETSTPAPTPTPTAGILYAAPRLVAPEDVSLLTQGSISVYPLLWTWEGTLQANEWFDVRIWRTGQPHHGIAWTKSWDYHYDLCLLGSGDFYWSMAIIRGEDGQWQGDLSLEAEPHRFTSFQYDDWCEEHGRFVIRTTPQP